MGYRMERLLLTNSPYKLMTCIQHNRRFWIQLIVRLHFVIFSLSSTFLWGNVSIISKYVLLVVVVHELSTDVTVAYMFQEFATDGCRIFSYHREWMKITSDEWVLHSPGMTQGCVRKTFSSDRSTDHKYTKCFSKTIYFRRNRKFVRKIWHRGCSHDPGRSRILQHLFVVP
jgi:hypothetical protein